MSSVEVTDCYKCVYWLTYLSCLVTECWRNFIKLWLRNRINARSFKEKFWVWEKKNKYKVSNPKIKMKMTISNCLDVWLRKQFRFLGKRKIKLLFTFTFYQSLFFFFFKYFHELKEILISQKQNSSW